ncbi:MAG: four helix bundle protein [Acidobacteria bacterium]|nr:four helix bundle protein [Acidobacteriota bacterium]MBV9146362.1 four helix bundle protein [Acidobacteriota bacterium]MBV9437800.1 four helix bundle protein [Acidobacteriota bacterium]
MKDFRLLQVWQRAHKLSLAIYKVTGSFPVDERFGLTSQVRRCAVSIEANIAEGCGRGSDLEFRKFLYVALGSASELDCELLLGHDLGFLSKHDYEQILTELKSLKAMLSTLIRKITADGR